MKPAEMPKPAKIASTKALTDLGYSIRQIARIMGIDEDTVMRYQKKELSEEWGRFADTIKKIWLEQDFELSQLAYHEMKKKLPKARFFELVGLYKTVRELQQPKEGMTFYQKIELKPPLAEIPDIEIPEEQNAQSSDNCDQKNKNP